MGFTAQSGSVGFRKQSVKGTYANPGVGSNGVFMKTRSGSLAGDRTLIIPEPEIGGGRDVVDAYLGPVAFKGQYAFYPRMNSLASLLYYALGIEQTTQNTPEVGAHKHAITPVDIANLPWFSIEENIGNDLEHFRYTDAKVNQLHVEVAAEGILTGTVDIVALSQESVPSASATPTGGAPWDNTPMVVGTNTELLLDNVSIPAKGWSLDINNQLEDDDFRIGSLFLGDATEKRRLVTMGAKLRPESNELYRQAVYGAPTAEAAGGLVTHMDVKLRVRTYEFIGATATVFQTEFHFGQGIIEPFILDPQNDNAIEHDVTLQIVRPNPANPIVTAEVINGLTTVK